MLIIVCVFFFWFFFISLLPGTPQHFASLAQSHGCLLTWLPHAHVLCAPCVSVDVNYCMIDEIDLKGNLYVKKGRKQLNAKKFAMPDHIVLPVRTVRMSQ